MISVRDTATLPVTELLTALHKYYLLISTPETIIIFFYEDQPYIERVADEERQILGVAETLQPDEYSPYPTPSPHDFQTSG